MGFYLISREKKRIPLKGQNWFECFGKSHLNINFDVNFTL